LKGYCRFAFADINGIKSNGTLLTLIVKLRNYGATELMFNDLKYESGYVNPKFFGNTSISWVNGKATVLTHNKPPIFEKYDNYFVKVNNTINIKIKAIDVENDKITYKVYELPNNANFNEESGDFSWTPLPYQVGQNDLLFFATDGISSSTLNITIYVLQDVVKIENDGVLKGFVEINNYPNPFNSATIFEFTLPKELYTKLDVFDISGKKINTLINEIKSPGIHRISFNASALSAGIYVCKLEAGDYVSIKKIICMK
jgi:hypothetical protein